jgi:hypothetical protein
MEILLLFMGATQWGYTMVLSQQGLHNGTGTQSAGATQWGYTMVLSQQGLHNGTGTQSAGATQWGYTMVLSQQGLHNGTGTQSAGATQWGYTMVLSQQGLHIVHMYLGYLPGAVRACMRCVHACDGWHCWHARPQQQPVGACSGGRT